MALDYRNKYKNTSSNWKRSWMRDMILYFTP